MCDRLRVGWPVRFLPSTAAATAAAPAAALCVAFGALLLGLRIGIGSLRRPLCLRRALAIPSLLVARFGAAGAILAVTAFIVAITVPIPVAIPVAIPIAIAARSALAAMRSPATTIVAVITSVTASGAILASWRAGRFNGFARRCFTAPEECRDPGPESRPAFRARNRCGRLRGRRRRRNRLHGGRRRGGPLVGRRLEIELDRCLSRHLVARHGVLGKGQLVVANSPDGVVRGLHVRIGHQHDVNLALAFEPVQPFPLFVYQEGRYVDRQLRNDSRRAVLADFLADEAEHRERH